MQTPFNYLTFLRSCILYPPVRTIVGVLWVGAAIGLGAGAAQLLADPSGAIKALAMIVAAIAGYYAFVRVVERRPVTELLYAGAAWDAGSGAAIGLCLFSAIIGIIYLLGGYTATLRGTPDALVADLLVALMGGVTEELLVRAVLFRILESWLGSWLTLVISAVIFGALHIANPHATLLSSAAIALEAGVMLAAAFMVTRRIWMPIGLHAAWNFTQGSIFGLPVSGRASSGWLAGQARGTDLISGGDFGPEASLVAVLVCLALGICLLCIAYARGNVLAPSWRRGAPAR